MSTASGQFDMSAAPMRIGRVRLKVRDLATVSDFYRDALGLAVMETGGGSVTLGTAGAPLLVLEGDPSLAANDRRQAGLFHTAFLLPTRRDLARWLGHAGQRRVRLLGAADHIVSEALYLADPEGNGIEIYADHPVSRWHGPDGAIRMSTDPLDVQELLAAAGGARWAGFPEQGRIGHVHLQIGEIAAADRFYRDILGFEVTTDYPGARFYGAGGYHHQLAGNVWNSRGAGRRPAGVAGLDDIEIVFRDPAGMRVALARAESAGVEMEQGDGRATLRDPWGIAVTLTH